VSRWLRVALDREPELRQGVLSMRPNHASLPESLTSIVAVFAGTFDLLGNRSSRTRLPGA
jgi:hypothetical protein